MQKIWFKITSNKSNPLYWPILAFLWIISLFYRLGFSLKVRFTSATIRTKATVVSVGNLTVGGTGKTPMVIELARYFVLSGRKVGVVSSAYGRRHDKDIIGSGEELQSGSIFDLGDEVMVMVHALPEVSFGISKSKSNAARLLDNNYELDVIFIDDGFQHRRLHRDYDILLLEAGHDIRKDSLFPLGSLREPADSIGRADAVIFTKTNFSPIQMEYREWVGWIMRDKILAEVEYFNENAISPDERLTIESLTERKVYFFAGIGGFDRLLNYLRTRFNNLVGHRQFPDHCSYPPSDTALIKNDIDKLGPEIVITTYKDFVKLRNFDFGRKIYYLDLKLGFTNGEKELLKALESVVNK